DDGHSRCQGCAEPAGESFSQRGRGGVGGVGDGLGPGGGGVGGGRGGGGGGVIGVGGVDVDPMLPVLGNLPEVRAVGEFKEGGPCGVHEFRDARCAPVGVQRKVGCEGPDQGVVVVAGERVANLGAGHETAEAAQWLLVDEQFLGELPECDGGRVGAV